MTDSAHSQFRRIYSLLDEIVTSEETYISQLNVILKYFIDPALCSGVLNVSETNILFGDIQSIRLLNQVFFDQLVLMKSRMIFTSTTPFDNHGQLIVAPVEDLVEIFLRFGPYLKIYSSYALNYVNSQTKLMSLGSQKKWSEWLDIQESNPAVNGLKLPALLILPIQRIPRYKLLLCELTKCVPLSWNCYSLLKDAFDSVSQLACYIDTKIAQFDSVRKMLDIQQSLLGKHRNKLVRAGRYFVKEENIAMMSKDGKKRMDRRFILFSDLFLVAKGVVTGLNLSKKYQICYMMPLHHCRVERILGSNLLKVSCKRFDNLMIWCNDFDSTNQWFQVMTDSIGKAVSNRKTLLKESMPCQARGLPARRTSTLTKLFKEKGRERNELRQARSCDSSNGLAGQIVFRANNIKARLRRCGQITAAHLAFGHQNAEHSGNVDVEFRHTSLATTTQNNKRRTSFLHSDLLPPTKKMKPGLRIPSTIIEDDCISPVDNSPVVDLRDIPSNKRCISYRSSQLEPWWKQYESPVVVPISANNINNSSVWSRMKGCILF